ncbi:MAG: UDP-N-acetylmuramoyl-L-alanine--D-glutamate ligase [Myxococcales bacterium]|nr:UDP-N-acetylmuramoyl-L-alanine--D-glutamate ligase [Myxococcales bacterium]
MSASERHAVPEADELAASAVWRSVEGASFAVLGLGRSGVAAANALARRGADVMAWDDQPHERIASQVAKLDPRVTARCGSPYVARPGEIAVLSPGIGPTTPTFRRARASAALIIGEIELFYRLDRAANDGLGHPIVAITGTDGKTTTASLIAELFEKAGHEVLLAGNIGEPLCNHIDSLGPQAIVVAEVSAFQLITAPLFRPRVAVLTNIAPDHLDYFGGDFEAYAAAKLAVCQRSGAGDVIVYNGVDPRLTAYASQHKDQQPTGARFWSFSARRALESGFTADGERLIRVGPAGTSAFCEMGELGADGERPWGGIHNQDNALAAAAAATALGLSPSEIRLGLRSFAPPPHRCEPVGNIGGVRFINDSKATNPHAAIAGLLGTEVPVGQRLVWIGGGSEKDASFDELAAVVNARADAVILAGATATRIEQALRTAGPTPPIQHAPTLHAAVPMALQAAGEGGVVLLSPACASFDAFKSYAHRGEEFRQAVTQLARAMGV